MKKKDCDFFFLSQFLCMSAQNVAQSQNARSSFPFLFHLSRILARVVFVTLVADKKK